MKKSVNKFLLAVILSIFGCIFAGCKSSTEIIYLTSDVQAPSIRYIENSSPDTLMIRFNGSAAKLEDIEKTPSGKITISPEISGTWEWTSDSVLVFTPKENWQLNTKYKITFPPEIFAENIVVSDSPTFTTGRFSLNLNDADFYIDPENPNIKRVTFTIKGSHPIDKESLSNFISLTLETQSKKGQKPSKIDVNFSVSYNNNSTEAYVVSDPIPMPPKTSDLLVSVKDGIKTTFGDKSSNEMNTTVEIPGMSDYVSIKRVEHFLVKNDDQNYDQVFSITTKGEVSVEELASHLTIYKLPNDRPEEQGWSYNKNYNWNNGKNYVTETVLNSSTKVPFTAMPTEKPASTVNTFKFKTDPNSYLYIYLSGNINFFGGYRLEDPYDSIFRVKEYPKELSILSEGTILSLSGSKKMAMYSRGVSEVKYTLSRIMPKDVNHLVSMSNGDMKNFRFNNYNFNENNISEKQTFEYKIPDYSTEYISYFSYDFTDQLKTDVEKHLSNGLFIFSVQDKQSSSREDKRFILVTDLGFFVKRNRDNTKDVFVQSISTGLPVPNAEVSIVGLNGNVIVSTTTDSKGHAVLPDTPTKLYNGEHAPTAYVVQTKNDLSFMPYSERGRTLDYSNYDIGGVYGADEPTKISAYMFSDRGMYRPGDTANFGIIVKSGDWNIDLTNLSLECEVTDSNSSVIYSKQFQLPSSGFDEISFTTQDYSPTGVYNVNLYLLKQYSDGIRREFLTSESVKVEEFLPDNLTVSTTFEPLPKEGWINPGQLTGVVNVKNLFGTPAAGNDVKAELTLTPGFPVLRKYSDYYFVDPYYKGNSYSEYLDPAVTDENGEARFNLNTQKFEKATYKLEFYAEAFEKGAGRSVSQQSSLYISPLSYLIGYKADGSLSYINKKSVRKLSFIAINQNLEKIDLNDVTLSLEEVKYVSTLVKQPNGLYKYQSVKKSYPISSEKISIKKDGTDYFIDSETPGEYKLILSDKDGLVFNTINYSIIGDTNTSRSLTRTAELEISLESSDLNAGETAKVFIKAPYAGSGLITVERDHVYTYKWFKTSELSSVQTIEVPKNLEGNGYINVMFARDSSSDEIFMSPFCYGAVPFSINKEARTNHITLEVPEEIKSGSDLNITYSSSDTGKIVIYAVDEGILQVAGYSMPDPLAKFFRKRALEVRTSQILDLVLPEYEILQAMSAMGGGAGMDELARNLNPFKRKQNKPVAFWSGIIDTSSEKRTVTYHIPDYFNGTVRVMAVAVSKDTIGVEKTSALARNTFIISPNTPLAAAPGDEFDVSVTVTNNHKGSGDNDKITLTVSPTKNLEVMGSTTIPLTISEGKDATTTLRVKAKNSLGNAELTFTAKDSSESSKLSASMSIRPSMPYQIWLSSGSSEKKDVEVDTNHRLYSEYATRQVDVSNVPTSFTNGLSFYLENYPYGCSEQITSKAYPYLYEDFLKANNLTRADAEKKISETVGILQSRMKSDGNIGYWTTKSTADPFITLYVAEFLVDAKNKGFYVSPTFLNKVLSAVTSFATVRSEITESDAYTTAYAIFILTKNEMVTTTYIEEFENAITRKNFEATSYEGLYLAASYAMLKQDKKANNIMKKIKNQRFFDSSWLYHNSLHYISTYIDLICTYFPSSINGIKSSEINLLVDQLYYSNYNTYSNAAAIRAIESLAYVDKTDMYTVIEKAGKTTTTVKLDNKGTKLSGNFNDSAESLVLSKETTLPMFYQVLQAGYETSIPTEKITDGIEVYREYTDLNGKPLSKITVGDEVIVKISFRSLNGSKRNIAMIDLQPAGLEGDIESIRNNDAHDWNPDYVDIREDRVILYGTLSDKVHTFTYKAKAINSGKFIVPPMFAESMYNKDVRAITPQNPIEIEAR